MEEKNKFVTGGRVKSLFFFFLKLDFLLCEQKKKKKEKKEPEDPFKSLSGSEEAVLARVWRSFLLSQRLFSFIFLPPNEQKGEE